MQCKEIIEVLEQDYSRSYALPWDNVGLLAGRDDKEVKKIYVAVDATDEVIEAACACKADMLITHHPLIFGGRMKITNEDFIGRRLLKLIRQDISYYAMHTNYDEMCIRDSNRPDVIINCAGVVDVELCEANPELAYRCLLYTSSRLFREQGFIIPYTIL